jgi:uncharacterized membrane protein YoaK (UPF0700 family)
MISLDRRHKITAISLAAVAGYVDALAFIALGGFFVSFMSGNSTRLGVGTAEWSSHALVALALIGSFVGGVILGSLVGRLAERRRRPIVLTLVSALLAIASTVAMFNVRGIATIVMAAAMGAANAVFEENGDVRFGVTYMTGSLVKMGQRIATALRGGNPFGWVPYFLLWGGLVAGAVTGGVVYTWVGLRGLWIATGVTAVLAATMELQPLDD